MPGVVFGPLLACSTQDFGERRMGSVGMAILTAALLWADVQYVQRAGTTDYPHSMTVGFLILVSMALTFVLAVVK